MSRGGDELVVHDRMGNELTRIKIGKVLLSYPFIGAEIFIRFVLSRIWRILATNRIRRDLIKAEWAEYNLDALSGMLQYGVVVAPRPDKEEDD